MNATLVFTGPTLSWEAVRQFPGAMPLPPAAQGDVQLAVQTHRPKALLLVDGLEFGRGAVAWHKELLYALEQGVRVYGAGALGAQYAVDLEAYGMVGLGEVFRLYRERRIEAVDDVAAAYEQHGEIFERNSISMINLHATCVRAEAAQVANTDTLQAILAAAETIPFGQRTLSRLRQATASRGLPEGAFDAFAAFCTEHFHDLQQEDALEALRNITSSTPPAPNSAAPYAFSKSVVSQMALERERLVDIDGTSCRISEIVSHAALHQPGFSAVCTHALHRSLVLLLAEEMRVVPNADEIAEEKIRFWRRLRLTTKEAQLAWQQRNQCADDVFDALMREEAALRRMRRWLLNLFAQANGPAAIVKQLWLDNAYEEAACNAKREHALLEKDLDDRCVQLRALAEQPQIIQNHFRANPGLDIDADYAAWVSDLGLSQEEAYMGLVRAAAARKRMEALLLATASENPINQAPE